MGRQKLRLQLGHPWRAKTGGKEPKAPATLHEKPGGGSRCRVSRYKRAAASAISFLPKKMKIAVVIIHEPPRLRHPMETSPPNTAQEARYLRWIAILNLTKGSLLCLLAIGLLGFLHKDLDAIVKSWVSFLGFNMEGKHIVRLLAHVDKVTDKQLAEWSGITFAIAGVFIAEGTGLLFRQQWAQYLTISATASFIPIEIYEIHRHFGWMKLAVLFVNVAIVLFLAILLVRERRRTLQQTASLAVPPGQAPVSCGSA